jgi:hypothetical protein
MFEPLAPRVVLASSFSAVDVTVGEGDVAIVTVTLDSPPSETEIKPFTTKLVPDGSIQDIIDRGRGYLRSTSLSDLNQAVKKYIKDGGAADAMQRHYDNLTGVMGRMNVTTNSKTFMKATGILKGVAKRAPLGIGALVSVVSIADDVEAYGTVEGVGRNLPVVGDIVSLSLDTVELATALRDIHLLKKKDQSAELLELCRETRARREFQDIFEQFEEWKLTNDYIPPGFTDNLSDAMKELADKIDAAVKPKVDEETGSFEWEIDSDAIQDAKNEFSTELQNLNLGPAPPGPLG